MYKHEKAYEIIQYYINAVKQKSGVFFDELISKSRKQEFVNARFAVMYLCDKYHPKEVPNAAMSKYFDLDHSSINHAIATAKNDIEQGVFYHWIGEVKKRNRITISENGKRIFCFGEEVTEQEFREAFATYLNATR